MENDPQYVCMWVGLSRLGVVSSLVNYNLRLQPLKHCFEAVNCKGIIYNPGLSHALEELVDLGGLQNLDLFYIGHETSEQLVNISQDLMKLLSTASDKPPTPKEPVGFLDPLMYIYTSGTTGLPKAATIKNSRYFMAAIGNFYTHGLNKNDVVYTSLPLYHGSGTMLGAGTMLTYGLVQVLRKKFSASNFWKDCIRYNCTAAQYIGEVCRYLLAQPPSSLDNSHKVRVMFGNGLRAELWKEFVTRFNISHISELYGATEGNCNMVNIDDTIGAVGFVPIWTDRILPLLLIKVDEEGNPIRDPKTGLAVRCKINEPGELLGKIRRNHPISDFEGYADKNSSKDKVIVGVKRKGDHWFRSGDILVQDELGYFYFKDRKGDTFRWKGENCSTAEVESVISTVGQLQDAVVVGVEVPGAEGRAGMAIIADPNNTLDLDALAEGIAKALPSYARPLFIRVVEKIETTGTYKLKKVDYQKVGYDINKTDDKIYLLSGGKYVPLTQQLFENIMTRNLKL
jgi:solute carrier family 27 fatty acid transporter 1/4